MRHGLRKDYAKGINRHRSYRFPVEKFLQSRLGKHWDKVYSEMKEEFDSRTYAADVFFKTLKHYVTINCWFDEDKVLRTVKDYRLFNDQGSEVEGYYVHPKSKCLCYKKPTPRPSRDKPEVLEIVLATGIKEMIWVGGRYSPRRYIARKTLSKINGIWYYVEWAKCPYWNPPLFVGDEGRYSEYTTIRSFQLSHKELKRYGLTNNTPEEIKEILRLQDEKERAEEAAIKARHELWAKIAAEREARAAKKKAVGE